MRNMSFDFDIGAAVHMDGLIDLRGWITAISILPGGTTYEVAWWNERQHCSAWFQPHRLAAIEDPRP